jgi:hypothetical protein
MAINRIRIGKQAELSIAPNSIVRTDINNEQEYVSPLSDNYPNRIDNIVATTTYDALNPLIGWVPPSNPILDNVTQVQFTDGTVVNYTWDGTAWVVDFVEEVAPKPTLTTVVGGAGLPNTATFDNGIDPPTIFDYIEGARNNLQLGSPIVERGNINAGGSQPADYTRDIYNWLGGSYKDHWQSVGDNELLSIKAAQTVNAANTTYTGTGAVNIGTAGGGGQYKLNVGGAIWVNNGRASVIVGRNAGLNDISTENVLIGDYTGENNTGDGSTIVGRFAGRFNTGSTSTIIGYESGTNNTGNSTIAIGRSAGRNNTGFNGVFIGSSAGFNNTGQQSVGIGYQALKDNTGQQSIGIGVLAAVNNIGSSLIAIGNTVGFNNTGNSATFIGNNAGVSNEGDFVVSIGIGSGNANKGFNLIGIGYNSGSNNLGDSCIGIGFQSIAENSKEDVIAIGYQTAKTNNASRVIAIGYRAGDDFTTPNTTLEGNNVKETILIGSHAGHNQGLISGSEVHTDTIGIGNYALGNSDGSYVIAIGSSAGLVNTQSNRVIIGFNELPQFANAAAAAAAMPAASVNGVYVYWDLSDNTIKARP